MSIINSNGDVYQSMPTSYMNHMILENEILYSPNPTLSMLTPDKPPHCRRFQLAQLADAVAAHSGAYRRRHQRLRKRQSHDLFHQMPTRSKTKGTNIAFNKNHTRSMS